MNFPAELKYTEDHEWVRIEGNEAVVGVTDFAQSELGDIVYVDIDSADKSLEKGEVFGTVEAVKTVSDLFMPLTGKVIKVNPALEEQPDLVNSDCYGAGWVIKIALDPSEEMNSLLSAEKYEKLL